MKSALVELRALTWPILFVLAMSIDTRHIQNRLLYALLYTNDVYSASYNRIHLQYLVQNLNDPLKQQV